MGNEGGGGGVRDGVGGLRENERDSQGLQLHGITTLDLKELNATERLLLSNDLFWIEEQEGVSRARAERILWERITAGGNPEVDEEGVGVLKRYIRSLGVEQEKLEQARTDAYFDRRHETKVRRGNAGPGGRW